MGKPKNFIYTQIDAKPAVVLEISGIRYEVTQYNDSWAVNEIPIAQLVVAVGRDCRSGEASRKAAVHLNNKFRQMTKAKVFLNIQNEYDAFGKMWPPGETVIFEGYFLGFIPRKVMGKYQVVASLAHWTLDMTCSSCLTSTGHFTNPTQLNVAAILPAGADTSNLAAYTHIAERGYVVQSEIRSDVWGAIKTIFCGMANTPTLAMTPNGACSGSGNARTNLRAIAALKRFEGSGGECTFEGDGAYAVPLRLKSLSAIMSKNVTDALINDTLGHYANVSFWDKLIGQFCPEFGMAVVPMVDRCLVVADTPGYRGGYWRTIGPDEYDSLDLSPSLEMPVRAIGVTSQYVVETQSGMENREGGNLTIGGCYVEDSVDPADGVIRIVDPPRWLTNKYTLLDGGGGPSGIRQDEAGRFVGCDSMGRRLSDVFGADDVKLYSDYAHMVYVNGMIRGRTGQLAGRLRFDIAPNSLIRLTQRGEALMEGEDELAMTYIACVSRVNNSISAEGPRAGTTFQLSHLRREDPENKEDRTSVSEHPLFGKSIHGQGKHGAPLVPKYDL